MLVTMIMKSRRYKFLIVGVVVCLSVIFGMFVLPVLVFPLTVDLSSHVVHIGDTISGTLAITNKSGNDVHVISNGQQPCIFFHKVNDRINHAEILFRDEQILKAGNKLSYDFEYKVTEPGIYILDAHYSFSVNSYPFHNRLYNIVVVLK